MCSLEENEIVLFNSPIYREKSEDGEDYLPPLGQGYIITSLRQHGISANLIDCVYERLGVMDIIEIINHGSFRHIGFNVFSVNMSLVKEIIIGIERKVHIFFGGKAVEHLWKEIISWNIPQVMTFVIGEGENILPDLILNKCAEMPIFSEGGYSVYSVNKHSCYYPANLDNVYLDRELFKGREILNRYHRQEACIIASRGCIYNCAFCGGAISANPNTTARTRSTASLTSEINDIIRQCSKVQSIRVLDDLFLKDRKSIIHACNLFATFPQLHWRCMAHINTFLNNQDLISQMKMSGCDEVFVGIESGSAEVRRHIHKLGTPQDVIDVVSALLAGGINVKGYFICGFPNETEQQLQKTYELAKILHGIAKDTKGCFRSVVFQFRPYHGTELFNQLFQFNSPVDYVRQDRLMNDKSQYNFSAGNFSNVKDEVLEFYIRQISELNN